MRKCFSLLLISIFWSLTHWAQSNTVGLIAFQPARTSQGYTLFYTHHQGTVYLINNCGQVVHEWKDSTYLPGNSAKLMPDGSIYITKGHGDFTNPFIKAGGGGMKIEHRDWDNRLLWEYTYNDSLKRMHHDFTVLPNGNVIFIAWEVKSQKDAVRAGRDSTLLVDCQLLAEHLVEIKPQGMRGGEVVWQWHVWDHLVQDFNPDAENFGRVKDHPERIDLNFIYRGGYADWLHMNSIDYNSRLDMLMLSIPVFSEIWIIDHSTTTLEAASHTGGKSGMGGDLLFRWGNPLTYGGGAENERKIGYQHDAHWMENDPESSPLDQGEIILFSNNTGKLMSTVVVVKPIFTQGHFAKDKDSFLPHIPEISFCATDTLGMYSPSSGSAQRLYNGNFFVCAGRQGSLLEIAPDGSVVWEYKVPLDKGQHVAQGSFVEPGNNNTFRAQKFPMNWAGFRGRSLEAHGYVERNPNVNFCDPEIDGENSGVVAHVSFGVNNRDGLIEIMGLNRIVDYSVVLYCAMGVQILNLNCDNISSISIDCRDFPLGYYTIHVSGDGEIVRGEVILTEILQDSAE